MSIIENLDEINLKRFQKIDMVIFHINCLSQPAIFTPIRIYRQTPRHLQIYNFKEHILIWEFRW